MVFKLTAVLFALGVLEPSLPLLAEEPAKRPAQSSHTEQLNFGPGGTIHLDGSYGDLKVEGWDRSEVEITVTKLTRYHDPQQREPAQQRLERIRVAAERRSDSELVINTMRSRRRLFAPLFATVTDGVTVDYEIRAPRDSKLVIHHATGSVLVNNMAGDIEATGQRGDIVLMLAASGKYSIDAKTKVGTVSSDFEGSARLRRYWLGERYATNSPSSHRIHLRIGVGGITIKALPPEAEPPVMARAQ